MNEYQFLTRNWDVMIVEPFPYLSSRISSSALLSQKAIDHLVRNNLRMRYTKIIVIILLTQFNLSSCKQDLPSTPTVVIGTFFDEDNIPMKNVTVLMTGLKFSGLSGFPTFEIQTQNDSLGFYSLSQLIPDETENVQMDAYYDDHVNPITSYLLYVPKNGSFVRKNGPFYVRSSSYGKTDTLNFQFRKR